MSLFGLTSAALAIATLAASPASANDRHGPKAAHHGQTYGNQTYGQGPIYYPPMVGAPWPTTVMEERCRKVYGDKGIGGALLGGLVGGVIGNRVAGGNRTLGTVAGAAVGAIAGTAIDKAEDRDLRRECDDYARSVQAQGSYGYGAPGGYAPYGYVMVPVMLPPQKPCVETTVVTERWVDVPVRRRSAPRRAPTKRIKEKRVYTG